MDGVRTLTGSTNLAYGPSCSLTWLPVKLAACEHGLWIQRCEFGWAQLDSASSLWTWPVDPSCGFSSEDVAYEPSWGLWTWFKNLAWACGFGLRR